VKVVLLDRALAQLVERFDYVAAENVEAAYRVMERILEALRQLEEFPQSGRRIQEFPHRRERELIVPPFRIQYRVEGDTVWIVGVWHGRQDVTVEEADD
jgi:plasmid stabilization system protein ParE